MGKINKGLMTCYSIEWSTPQWLFDILNIEFNFTLDPCATKENAKCKSYYTKQDNGLEKNWDNQVVFVNPPYGSQIKFWIEKSYKESLKNNTVVMLIPSRTDTKYWHEYVMKAKEIRLIKGRLKFGLSKNGSAPFPSCVVIFSNKKNKNINVIGWDVGGYKK